MASITLVDVVSTIAMHRESIGKFMQESVRLHGDTIRDEIALFDLARESDPESWAKLCMLKSILSSGAVLVPNIEYAKHLHGKMLAGWVPSTYEDVDDEREKVNHTDIRYGSKSGGMPMRGVLMSWEFVADIQADSMTYDSLAQAKKDGRIVGQAYKTRCWSLALYDANQRVYTIDSWMTQIISRLAGLSCKGINDNAYLPLMALMLSIHDEYIGADTPPLVSQWAMWNETRHPGQHASHALLAE